MADIFEKCDIFWRRMHRMAGDEFDALRATFSRVYPTTNCTPHVEYDGRRMLQVATNDYLGLATHPEAIAAAAAVIHEHGAGTPLGARPLTCHVQDWPRFPTSPEDADSDRREIPIRRGAPGDLRQDAGYTLPTQASEFE